MLVWYRFRVEIDFLNNICCSIVQKRKLSDKSGSKWNDEELKMFYEAYRKYGKDWKKVRSCFAVIFSRHHIYSLEI